ncbi:GNAT family N-acetyltransferase [Flavitalea antarctica]
MDHVLDNPIWEGLQSGNKHLALGSDEVKYFPDEITTFAGFRSFSLKHFKELHEMLPSGSVRATFVPHKVDVVDPWIPLPGAEIYQMIHNNDKIAGDNDKNAGTANKSAVDIMLVSLGVKDVPAMLTLAKLTNPGPFNVRTIEFGNFYGVFVGKQLVAMAGQRLQVHEYAEISAVCTHPHHQGKGYARSLILHQIGLIRQEGRKPMLHVKTDNHNALALYESLGFTIRRKLDVIIFRKE